PAKGEATRGVRRELGLDLDSAPAPGAGAEVGTGEGPSNGVVRQGGLFDKELARRRSGSMGAGGEKKRRRYDSGLGFLDEEAEEGEGVIGRAL
ncbi:hypothetical protein V492_03961, partial [Pseudogymnoascus sp. VKM F-4246]